MTPTDFGDFVGDVWTTWAPGITVAAGVILTASVAIYLFTRFGPSLATRLFKGK